MGISAENRLKILFDDGSVTYLDSGMRSGDAPAEVKTAYGCINGTPAYAFAQDSEVKGGAVGKAHAAKIARVYDLALKTGCPLVGVYDSAGAHIDESFNILEAFGILYKKSGDLSGVCPQISVVLGTCAGSAAVLAAHADIIVMEKNAELFYNSPFVLRDKSGKVGTSDTALANGCADIVCDGEETAIAKAREVLSYFPQNNLSSPQYYVDADAAEVPVDSAADKLIYSAADPGSALTLTEGFAPGVTTALVRTGGLAAGAVCIMPENDKKEIDTASVRKISKFVRMCDAFSLPVITFIDSRGFRSDIGDEIGGAVLSTAMLTQTYTETTTAKISVITGEAYGPVFAALSSRESGADAVFAWSGSAISALAPETAAIVLHGDEIGSGKATVEELAGAYKANEASADTAAERGYIDAVISPADTKAAVAATLDMLSGKRVPTVSRKHSDMPL